MKGTVYIRYCGSLVAGLAVSTGHPAGIIAGICFPALTLRQPNRRATYLSGLSYYAGALWPLMPSARNFFGPITSMFDAVLLWIIAAALLALPWPLVWSASRMQSLWRAPLGLALTGVPPLGIIGWASPLIAAGFLFPHTAWYGLLGSAFASSALAIWPLPTTTVTAATALALNLMFPAKAEPPNDWQGFDTHFGSIAHGPTNPFAQYSAAQWIQTRAESSHARVLVFPEMIVARWTAATDLFWQKVLARLSANGKTILVGAGVPVPNREDTIAALANYDFSAASAALREEDSLVRIHMDRVSSAQCSDTYRNAIVVRGAQAGIFIQRIPVPLGMWHPFRSDGVPLSLFGPSVIRIGDERAAILICYEQLLTWPVLISMLDHPTMIVAIANDYWIEGTPIPRYQANALQAWARLFAIPTISAANR